jgi:DNA photolyase
MCVHRSTPHGSTLKADTHALPTNGSGVLVWLRQDLRLNDNATLNAGIALAKQYNGYLTFAFVHSPEEDGDDPLSGMACPSWLPFGPRFFRHLRVGLAINKWVLFALKIWTVGCHPASGYS